MLLSLACAAQGSGKLFTLVESVDISCYGRRDGVLYIKYLEGALPVAYRWEKTNAALKAEGLLTQQAPSFEWTTLSAGTYALTLTDATGADTAVQITIREPAPLSGQIHLLTDYKGFALPCAYSNDGRALATVLGGTAKIGYQYQWSNGTRDITADSLPPGPIRVTVTDDRDCSLTLSGFISAPPPLQAKLYVSGEKCYGENSGFVEIKSISGGIGPYQSSLDGNPSQTPSPQWSNLPPGQHLARISDANDCQLVLAAILPVGPRFIFDAGPDTVMFSGDTLLLAPGQGLPIANLSWAPEKYVYSENPTTARVFPLSTAAFTIVATDSAGCTSKDQLVVQVNRRRDIFAPNVFMPEANDETNRFFTLYGGGGIAEIASLQIRDRYGRIWHEGRHFPIGESVYGWGGADAPAGVYMWLAVVQYTDGRMHTVSGTVSLIR